MSAKPKRPQRPRELQDALNFYLYHPMAWRLARLLAKTPVTPNMVSMLGALCVIAAAWSYAQAWFPESALLGLVLHMTWHVVDGADGDLARLTGRASPIGEMIDGLCDYLSHAVLYVTLGWLLSLSMGWTAWIWAVFAGVSHAVQSNHVEVQRRQYQYWVYGTPWIRQSHKAGSETAKSRASALVTLYINAAASMTPHALKIDDAVVAAQSDKPRRQTIRHAAKAKLLPLLVLCKWLGPNPRAIVLGGAMLAGGPGWHGALYYFLYQTVALNLLLVWSVRAHNRAAKRIAARIGA